MRAVAENPRIATLMGVNPNAIITLTFAIGGVFAALAGVDDGQQLRQRQLLHGLSARH
jgi:branched-subunit amino acid ABC-type transport system permease component